MDAPIENVSVVLHNGHAVAASVINGGSFYVRPLVVAVEPGKGIHDVVPI